MPAKGKHHHLSHHHHQPQQQAQQQQHLINVNQSGISGTSQSYNAVVAARGYVSHASSDFHVPGQNYSAQPGGQVGGGASSLGVSGGRGPPTLSGIQSIGQTTPGLQSGGPTGAQQPSAQTPTPGVQQQQPQGPAPTTTPPVHTPSPQEMGKQIHHPSQSTSLQQPYVTNQSRAVPQGFYPMATRPVQSRNSGHRNSQGSAPHVVSMPGVAGGAGQPSALYSHHANINVPGTSMLVPSQVPSMHTGHHTTMYPVNNQMPQLAFSQHRHQTHQSQQFFTSFPAHALIPSNLFPYTSGPTTQFAPYCFPTHHPQNNPMNLTRTSSNAVSGGGQHVGGPLAGAQGTVGVPQGTLQQQSQQPQTIPPMAISLTQTAYTGHSTGALASLHNKYQKVVARPCALTDIVDPATGKNIAEDFYKNAAASPGEDSNSRETPQPQDSAIAAEFASRVAKAASEDSELNTNSSASNVHNNQQSSTQPILNNQGIRNSKTPQSNPSKDPIVTQCNTNSSVPMRITTDSFSLPLIESSSSVTPTTNSFPVKLESKPFLPQSNEVWSQNEGQKQPALEETTSVSSSSNSLKDHNVTVQSTALLSTPSGSTPDTESKNTSITGSQAANVTIESSQSANGSPVLFSNRDRTQNAKASSNSPPRRKPSNYQQPQQSSNSIPATNNSLVPEVSATNKDSKDKKINDKTLNAPNKGASPALTNQNEQPQQQNYHQKSNGEGIEEKSETEAGAKNDAQQKSADSKSTQKQKSKNKLKGRDLNRKGAEKEGTDMDAFVNPASQPVKSEGKESLPLKTGQNVDQQQSQQPIVKEISIEEKEANLEKPESVTLNQQEQLIKSLSGETIIPSSNDSPMKDDTKSVGNSLTEGTVASETEELDKKITKDATVIIEDSNKSTNSLEKTNNDVVDHAIVNDTDNVEAIVAQKNEENTKVSANLRHASETNLTDTSVIEKQNENELSNKIETAPKAAVPRLRYNYGTHQWSPTNRDGKKEYDREFLMKLQDDPQCRVRPVNLPDLEVVLKDGSRQISRNNSVGLRMFKDTRAHEQLFPEFSKSSFNSKLPPPMNKKSYQGKSKVIKPNVIHVTLSLREDVKLRETENAWRPGHLTTQSSSEEDQKTQALYKKVRSILNKLTPQKFTPLVNQMKELEIDTKQKLEGVITLVFEKAIDEPNFSETYALMCQEISYIRVLKHPRASPDDDKNYINFRKMILIRCQAQFEKNDINEVERTKKLEEIEQCTEPEKKKELQSILDEQDRQIRMKSVGNIRFIGELYKQRMLTPKIMKSCINHLLQTIDEENLECLCKLLTTIGKIFEKEDSLAEDIRTMKELVSSKNKKISSRVRFMIQDVIDLRMNNWIPRRDENNPKTIDQIQKEAEMERIELPLNNPPINTRRGDDRVNDRRRNRSNIDDGSWSMAGGKVRQPYTVETSKLSTKPPAMDEIKLGSRNTYVWTIPAPSKNIINNNKFAVLESMGTDQDNRSSSILSGSRSIGPREYRTDTYKSSTWVGDNRGSRNGSYQMGNSSNLSRENSMMDGSRSQSISMPPLSDKNKPSTVSSGVPPRNAPSSNKPQKSEEELKEIIKALLDGCKSTADSRAFVTYAIEKIQDDFNPSTYPLFVRTSINSILDRSAVIRQRFSVLLAHMITKNFIPLSLFQSEYEKIIEFADELVIDIPMVWTYFAEILSELMVANAHPFSELKRTLEVLKTAGTSGKLLGELFQKLAKEQGPKWILDRWDQNGLQWSDLLHPNEKIDDIIRQYQIEFIINGCYNSEMPTSDKKVPLAERLDDIHSHLLRLLRDCRFDDVTSWITANVGPQSNEELFIKTLVTAILEVTIEPSGKSYKFLSDVFYQLLPLLTRYIDTEPQLELQCLIALEIHDFKLDHPQGILNKIINILYESGTISDDAFLAWQNHTDPTTVHSHPIAVTNLGTFLRSLRERSDSSEES